MKDIEGLTLARSQPLIPLPYSLLVNPTLAKIPYNDIIYRKFIHVHSPIIHKGQVLYLSPLVNMQNILLNAFFAGLLIISNCAVPYC